MDNSADGTNSAIFGSTAGTVTLNSTLSASNLQFTATGYTVSGSGTLTLGAGGIDASALGSGTTTIGDALSLFRRTTACGRSVRAARWPSTAPFPAPTARRLIFPPAASTPPVPHWPMMPTASSAAGRRRAIRPFATFGRLGGHQRQQHRHLWRLYRFLGYGGSTEPERETLRKTGRLPAGSYATPSPPPPPSIRWCSMMTLRLTRHDADAGHGGSAHAKHQPLDAGQRQRHHQFLTSSQQLGELFCPCSGRRDANDWPIWPIIADNGATPTSWSRMASSAG